MNLLVSKSFSWTNGCPSSETDRLGGFFSEQEDLLSFMQKRMRTSCRLDSIMMKSYEGRWWSGRRIGNLMESDTGGDDGGGRIIWRRVELILVSGTEPLDEELEEDEEGRTKAWSDSWQQRGERFKFENRDVIGCWRQNLVG